MTNLRFAAPVEERVAVVTGGARGIGRASALRMAEEGRNIVIADVIDEEGLTTVADIEAMGRQAEYVRTDVTDEGAVHALMEHTVDRYGRLDILVCCAGILGIEAPFLE
jgi:NAD(P)-dependent dehydrogenase (short-subunit alcohol dehydrogenase family)